MSDRAVGDYPAGGGNQAGRTGRALITGIRAAAGYSVSGLVHVHDNAPVPGVVVEHACDLRDPAGLTRSIDTVQPDVVAHLAAIAFVGHGDVDAMYGTNLIGTRDLLEALSKAAKPVRAVLLAGSANVYGNATEGRLTETALAAPANDYAVSKLAMEYMARLYADNLPMTIVRTFNYTEGGRSLQFLLPKIVGHVRDRAPVIELGNLDVARDFSDVRTVVQYYRALLETPAALGQTFNLCSGGGLYSCRNTGHGAGNFGPQFHQARQSGVRAAKRGQETHWQLRPASGNRRCPAGDTAERHLALDAGRTSLTAVLPVGALSHH